jgi:hypothetical protein
VGPPLWANFHKKSEGNADLLVGWGKLGRDDKGNLRGGHTDFKPEFHMNIINFSDDVDGATLLLRIMQVSLTWSHMR